MLVKALKSFKGRYGPIRAGEQFNCEPGYFAALKKNKLAVAVEETAPQGTPGPSSNRAVPEAPGKGGKDQPDNKGETSGSSEAPPAGGTGRTSASLRADLASRATTSSKSAGGVTSKSVKVAPKKKARTRVVLDPGSKDNPPAE